MESFSAEATDTQPKPLTQAFLFWTLRRRKNPPNPPPDWAIAAFGAASMILWLLLTRVRHGHYAQLLPFQVVLLPWYVAPVLIAAWVASRITQPRVEFRSVLFLLVVLAPIVIACTFLLAHSVTPILQKPAVVGLTAYVIVYLATGLRTLAGRPQVRAVAATIGIAALFTAYCSSIFLIPTLWWATDSEAQTNKGHRVVGTVSLDFDNVEELLISQPARIEAMVSRVTPAAENETGIYFVGFAGVGSQKVFAEEIKLAAKRVADRYGTADRTLLMLNDRRDTNSYPLATVSGLKLALKGIASRMHLDRDVLFLALSSHGSADPSLSVSNGALPIRDLRGTTLATALKESGIKWRVIVISACHAGAFIEPLQDDNTIILTAAAADRTSFGCSDDRDLTYFGEAFYRDALPKAATLRQAFDRAVADIASREQREGIKASNPQAFFGPALDQKLAQIESRNQRLPRP
jgi:peptidase C13-like protein